MSNTYLLTWNPDKWDFEGGYHSFLKQVNAGEKPVLEWRAANSSIQKGDVMYLMRLGAKPRGIILKVIALGSGHPSKHYDAERAAAGEVVNRVDVQFISAGDYTKGEFIDWRILKEQFPNQNWTPQASGIRIRDKYCNDLDELWARVSNGINMPMRPKSIIRKADGTVQYVCGRCETLFIENARCPNCGQLVKE